MESVQDLLHTARKLQDSGNIDGAVSIYENILNIEHNNIFAIHELGIMMLLREDFERSVHLLERAVILRPSNPIWQVDLGEAYRNLCDYRNAVGCCLTALRLQPNLPEALNTLGLAIQGTGDLKGALEQFRQAIVAQPDFFPGHTNAGLVLQELGEFEEAIGHFRRAVELSPNSSLIRTNIGLALLARDQAAEALIHFQEAVRLRPDLAILHHNLGNALRILSRPSEARASYLKAIRLNPGITISYIHIGITLHLDGMLADALRWHKLAIEMEPANHHFWGLTADLYLKREEPDEAVECRRRALDLLPIDRPDAHISLGWALQEDCRLDEALEQFQIAQRLQPNWAQPQFSLSGVYEEQGNMLEAERAVREAIRLQPKFPAAYSRLATLLRGRLPESDLKIIKELLSEPGLGIQPRARLLFALAHVLDARHEYTGAAACLKEANTLSLESKRAEGMIYFPDKHTQFVERLLRVFDENFFRRTAGLGLETRRPVFIIGFPRSGTTLVEQILASHPRVYGAGERLFGRRSFESLTAAVGRNVPPIECVNLIDEHSLKRVCIAHIGKLDALDGGRFDRIVDKFPDNYLYIGLLAAMFPNGFFIHCRRDVRDVALSCYMSDFRSIRWANDPGDISSRLSQYHRIMDHWKRVFPISILDVNYEDTVSDLEGVSRRLLDYCELEWASSCLDYYQTQRVVRTASLVQVRQPIYTSSVKRWKHYEDELTDLFKMISI